MSVKPEETRWVFPLALMPSFSEQHARARKSLPTAEPKAEPPSDVEKYWGFRCRPDRVATAQQKPKPYSFRQILHRPYTKSTASQKAKIATSLNGQLIDSKNVFGLPNRN